MLKNLKCALEIQCGMTETQIKLTILSMLTIIFQGIGLYFMDKRVIKFNLFIFVIIFGFVYNIMYFKTFIN